MMKKIMHTLIYLIFSQLLFAKVTSVQVGINGLTCSMCSRSVEMALKKLDFIDVIKMDLKQTQATITFKPNLPIDFRKLAKAVNDAGFSVRIVRVLFDELPSIKNNTFTIGRNTITLVNTKNDLKIQSIVLLGYDYMDKKQLKIWQTKYNNFTPFSKNDNFYFAGLE